MSQTLAESITELRQNIERLSALMQADEAALAVTPASNWSKITKLKYAISFRQSLLEGFRSELARRQKGA